LKDESTPRAEFSLSMQHQETLEVATRGRGFVDVTRAVREVLRRSGVGTGLCVVYCPHTSCSLMIQENADPSVRADLLGWLARLAPDGDPRYAHDAEGPDDMAAHLRSAVTRTSEAIPVVSGELALGRWQALYLVEHRLAPHGRRLVVHVQGERGP
jgi:secondary thiamine-phosphate synthase enzyme